jgi:hypothetical protein
MELIIIIWKQLTPQLQRAIITFFAYIIFDSE